MLILDPNSEQIQIEIIERLERRGVVYKQSFRKLADLNQALGQYSRTIMLINEPSLINIAQYLTLSLRHPLSMITPKIIGIDNIESKEASQLAGMTNVFVAHRTSNPMQFVSRAEKAISWYLADTFAPLRRAREYLLKNNIHRALQILAPKVKSTDVGPIAASLFSKLIKPSSDNTTVERIILGSLQANPKNLMILLAAVDFYLDAGMPDTALRLIKANASPYNTFLLPHEFHANLMLNKINRCAEILQAKPELFKFDQKYISMLTRCLYTTGRPLPSNLSHISQNMIDRIDELWITQSNDQSKPA